MISIKLLYSDIPYKKNTFIATIIETNFRKNILYVKLFLEASLIL